ncbi:MAG: hypothetical protein ABI623_11355, partial [bacterium]
MIDSAAYTGIYVWYTTRAIVSGNDVNGLAGYSGTKYGIYIGSTTLNCRVYNNKVHDLNQLSATGVTYALYTSGTSTLAGHSFFNNFVWGFSVPDAGTGAIYGIYDGTGNTTIADTIAYNTVNMNGATSGIKTSAAFYKASATGPAYVRDNVFQNTRTDGATGLALAIYKTTAGTVVNSNNNNLYVGTPDAVHQTGRISTTNYATIADWRTANASDANSVAENSPFVSATDLHMQTTVATQLESGGAPVAGITTDIDGGARNATTPDIGADEFAGIAADLTAPNITYTPLSNTAGTSARTLTTSITDFSGVPRAGTGLPRLFWKKNSGSYTAVTGTWTTGSTYTFTFGSRVVAGDTVGYYIVAQDSASTPNVGAYPSGGASGFTANPPTAATPPTTPSSYLITPPSLAAGDYTVGLTLFNRVLGKNLTSQAFTRRVMKQVPIGPEIDQKKNASAQTTSITPFEKTELREVEETYSVLMDGAQPYDGPTRVLLTNEARGQFDIAANVLGIYPTITAAMNDLSLRGVAGAVRFLLNDATYPSETFPITVNVTSDSVPTATKTVTIKPNIGVTATVSGAFASGPI